MDDKSLISAAFYGIGASALAAADIQAAAAGVVQHVLDKASPDDRNLLGTSLFLVADAIVKEHARAVAALTKEALAAEARAAAARARLASGKAPAPATPSAQSEADVPASKPDSSD